MKTVLELLCASVFSILVTGCTAGGKVMTPVSLAITGVTVIDPESRSIRPDHNVYINEGRIVAVLPSPDDAYLPAETVDGAGRYLIPGLVDMHAHTAHPLFSEATLALFIANGVTGVREMSGDCWEPRGELFACIDEYRRLQQGIASGAVTGPRLLSISSAIVRGPWERQPPHVPEGAADFVTPHDAGEARKLVRYLKDRDVDFIKTYNLLAPDVYVALTDEARRLGLPVAGHVPLSVNVQDASRHGHRSIEHARAIAWDCSAVGRDYRAAVRAAMNGREDVDVPGDGELMGRSIEEFDSTLCESVLATLAKNGTYYVPTHETREMDARAGEPEYRNDPRLAYIMDRMKGFWRSDLENTAKAGPEAAALYRRFFEHGLGITRLAHEAGVKIMAGTDANDTMSIPGFGLHDELVHLANAGLTSMDVLRAATIVPAEFLGLKESHGGIAAGKTADLVLLDADPLEDIANTTAISAVVFDGRLLDRAALDALLAHVKTLAAPVEAAIADVPRETLAAYAGTYLVASSELPVTVTLGDDGLQATAPGMPVINLLPESETRFFMKEDATTFEFIAGADGRATGLKLTWANGRSEIAQRTD